MAIGGIVIGSVKISNDDFGELQVSFDQINPWIMRFANIFQKQIDIPDECSATGDKKDTWWCKIITNEDNCKQHCIFTSKDPP